MTTGSHYRDRRFVLSASSTNMRTRDNHEWIMKPLKKKKEKTLHFNCKTSRQSKWRVNWRHTCMAERTMHRCHSLQQRVEAAKLAEKPVEPCWRRHHCSAHSRQVQLPHRGETRRRVKGNICSVTAIQSAPRFHPFWCSNPVKFSDVSPVTAFKGEMRHFVELSSESCCVHAAVTDKLG